MLMIWVEVVCDGIGDSVQFVEVVFTIDNEGGELGRQDCIQLLHLEKSI